MADPVELAEVVRSGVREGAHRGHAVIVDARGAVLQAWGDPHAQILPRSANKIAQASAMVRAGLPLTDELLALAAASHSGEPFHVDGVRRILGDIPADQLRTPPDWPWDEVDRCALRAEGLGPTSIFMNCSGKHAAMLVSCAVNGWSLDDYLSPDHPLQRAIATEVAELAGEEPWARAVDGCGAPLLGLSLAGLARSGSRAATADPGSPERRVADAMRDYPEWVAGTRRDATALSAGVPGLLLKEGAEGVYVAGLPDGTGIAVKIEDGTGRARQVVMAALLARLGIDSEIAREQSVIPLLGGSERVGEIRAMLD
ncbi:MAG: asparaginase [Candidatus Nanopelagicales bacterium]|jgi:L-asparaginase II